MTIALLKNIADKCPKDAQLLGLDVGKKTIGLATGSVEQGIATPLETLKRTKFTKDMQALSQIIDAYDIGGFVIGLPVNMDGTEGPRAQSIRDFAIEMEKYLLGKMSFRTPEAEESQASQGDSSAAPRNDMDTVWIALMDERLSTVSVEEYVDKLVDKRKTKTNAKTSGLVDKLAAQIILQTALDFIKSSNPHIA